MAPKASRQGKPGDRVTGNETTAEQPAPPPAAPVVTSPPAAATPAPAAAPAGPPDLEVHITLVCGGLTRVKTPVVIGARYDGLAFAGPTRAFDRLLDSWLTRAVDLGIIGSALGQLFPINLEQYHKAGKMGALNLLLAGMGEPGRFTQDSLQFVFSNIVVAIKAMGVGEFATGLIGTRRNEIPIGQAVTGLVQGIADGYERILAIAENVTEDKESLRAVAEQPLSITLVHSDAKKLGEIQQEFEALVKGKPFPKLKLAISRGEDIPADLLIEPSPTEAQPDEPVTYLRVTRSKSAAAGAMRGKAPVPATRKKSAARAMINLFATDLLQFSALSDVAVVPQREQEVNSHLMRDLADRMSEDATAQQRAERGFFFTNCMMPEADRGAGKPYPGGG